MLDKLPGAGAGDNELAHVGEVEQPHRFAHALMFLGDGAVLDRHQVARELDNLGPRLLVDIIERSFLWHKLLVPPVVGSFRHFPNVTNKPFIKLRGI